MCYFRNHALHRNKTLNTIIISKQQFYGSYALMHAFTIIQITLLHFHILYFCSIVGTKLKSNLKNNKKQKRDRVSHRQDYI